MVSVAADRSPRIWTPLFGAATIVFVADQVSKAVALEQLTPGRPIDVLWKLRWNLARNNGASFSLGDGLGPVIGVIVIFVVLAMLWVARGLTQTSSALTLGVVFGGAVGNLADRIARAEDGILSGAVIDFIDFQFWPVFNIGDMGIVVGSAVLLLLSWNEQGDDANDADIKPASIETDADEPTSSSTDDHDSVTP